MTAPIIYDDNFSVQLVPSHKHTPQLEAGGDEIVCSVCRSPLMVVCPNECKGALNTIIYSEAPVPRAPKKEEKRRKSRTPPRQKYQDIPGICRVLGCMKPRVPQAVRGVGRPPTNCIDHWHPVVKRGKGDGA